MRTSHQLGVDWSARISASNLYPNSFAINMVAFLDTAQAIINQDADDRTKGKGKETDHNVHPNRDLLKFLKEEFAASTQNRPIHPEVNAKDGTEYEVSMTDTRRMGTAMISVGLRTYQKLPLVRYQLRFND